MTVTVPPIVTYHSSNNKPEWFAYCKPNDEFLGVRFEGNTEAEAKERAKNWWVNETARQAKLAGKVELDDDEVSSKSYKSNDWGKPPSFSSTPSINKDHGMVGKVWLGNPTTKEKKRVDPSVVDAMMKEGWVRAGPRTVL